MFAEYWKLKLLTHNHSLTKINMPEDREEKQDLLNEIELKIRDHVREVKKAADDDYAIKLVERIVFGLVTLILIAVVGAWIQVVLR